MEQPVFEPRHRAEFRLAQCGSAPHDGVEHRLDVRRRARDRVQDLSRCGLLRQGFVALGGAPVEFSLERGNDLPQLGRRVVEYRHSVALPNPLVPFGISQRSTVRLPGRPDAAPERHTYYAREYPSAARPASDVAVYCGATHDIAQALDALR